MSEPSPERGRDFDTFPHDADVGIVGRGPTVEAAFVAAAHAMFAVMTDPTQVRPLRCVQVEFTEGDHELALVTWLNLLLAHASTEGLAFGRFELHRAAPAIAGSAPR